MHDHLRNCSALLSCNAGQGEDFTSVEQVVQCVRPGVLLNGASVPSVRNTDRHGRPVLLNRYILDFWKHGQKRALQEANGLREGRMSVCARMIWKATLSIMMSVSYLHHLQLH